MRAFATALVLLLAVFAGTLAAQEGRDSFIGPPTPPTTGQIDYVGWRDVASRAARISEAGKGSDFALERIRAEIVTWRDRFNGAVSVNSGRIATVRAQLEVIGPAPGSDGADASVTAESTVIAERRVELEAELARLRVPTLLAEEAFAQASGLISEIDGLIRIRQAGLLVERGSSPLNYSDWSTGFADVKATLSNPAREISSAWRSEARRDKFYAALPSMVVLILGGLVFLVGGRRWMAALAARVTASTERGKGVWRFLISLGQIALPYAGLLAISNGILMSSLTGIRGTEIVSILPSVGLFAVTARWIAYQFFPTEPGQAGPIGFPVTRRRSARRIVILLGWTIAVAAMANAVIQSGQPAPATLALVGFPFQAVAGYLVYRFGRLLARARLTEEGQEGQPVIGQLQRPLTILFGRAAMIAGVIGPVLAALGYHAAYDALVIPMILTFALVGMVMLLQRLVHDVYEMATARDGEAGDRLAPVLIAFTLAIVSIPVLALIWGARIEDLFEIWARFQAGFSLGDTRISPTSFVILASVFAVGYLLTRLLQATLRSTILPRTRIDLGGRNAIISGVGYVGVFLATIAAITAAGIDLSNLALVAGALSVGIGFGLQNIVSNFVSGIILLIERPISEGDWIEVGGRTGYVRDISVRSTRIETFDRTDVIVPNADLVSGQVVNWTRGNLVGRIIVPVGVAYGTDTGRVTAILSEIAQAHPMVLLNPPPAVLFIGFGASSLDFEIRAILRDVNFNMMVKSEINHQIARRFAEEGIEVPFPQRDLWLRNAAELHAGPAARDEDEDRP